MLALWEIRKVDWMCVRETRARQQSRNQKNALAQLPSQDPPTMRPIRGDVLLRLTITRGYATQSTSGSEVGHDVVSPAVILAARAFHVDTLWMRKFSAPTKIARSATLLEHANVMTLTLIPAGAHHMPHLLEAAGGQPVSYIDTAPFGRNVWECRVRW